MRPPLQSVLSNAIRSGEGHMRTVMRHSSSMKCVRDRGSRTFQSKDGVKSSEEKKVEDNDQSEGRQIGGSDRYFLTLPPLDLPSKSLPKADVRSRIPENKRRSMRAYHRGSLKLTPLPFAAAVRARQDFRRTSLRDEKSGRSTMASAKCSNEKFEDKQAAKEKCVFVLCKGIENRECCSLLCC